METINEEREQNREIIPSTRAARFVENVLTQFSAEMGTSLNLTAYEKTLAQHLFLKADQALKDAEEKRLADGKANQVPFTWDNVDARKLAIDAVHRVNLGLDALLPNHLHLIPRLNGRTQKYTLTLQTGYEGTLYYKTEAALIRPKRVIAELVYKTDKFQAIKLDMDHQTETFTHEVTDPFNRGDVIGGYGYIMYDDPALNKLVLVDMKELAAAEAAGNAKFWTGPHRKAMMLKTVVLRTMNHVKPDPRKINSSYAAVDNAEYDDVIDITDDHTPAPPKQIPVAPPHKVRQPEPEHIPFPDLANEMPSFLTDDE